MATDSPGHFFIKTAKKRYLPYPIKPSFGVAPNKQHTDNKNLFSKSGEANRELRGIFATWPQNEIPKASQAFQIVSDQGKFLLQRKGVVLLGLWRNQAGDLGGLPAA